MRPVPVMTLSVSVMLSAALGSCTALPPPREWLQPEPRSSLPTPGRRAPEPQTVSKLGWSDALRIASEQSPTVAGARERIGRAEALVAAAEARAFPRLDGRGSYLRFLEASNFRGRTGTDVSGLATRTRFVTERGSDIYSAGVDLSYPLFDGGDTYYATRAARDALDASRHDAETVEQELDLGVSTAFLNVLLAEGAIRIAAESLQFTEEQERQTRAREEAGEALKVDTLRFSTRASEERLALNQARAAKSTRLAVLAELLGVPLADDVELVVPTSGLEVPAAEAVKTALENRPEVRAIRAQLAAAQNTLAREKASWWPAINVFASYGFVTLDDVRLSQEDDEFQVGASLSMNLFEGGATAARTRALRHELAELDSRQRALTLQIEREVREAETELNVARQNVEVSEETARLAEEVRKRVAAQYRAGEAQVIDVTEATLQKARADLAFLRSRVNLLLSQTRLRRAAGLEVQPDS